MNNELFVTALLYLGAAIIMVPLVRKIGFSSVIGYILGGIIIGPFVLHLTGNADDVMHATEFGVVVLLFIVGLDLDPKKFWAMRKIIVGLGVSQVALTTIILYYLLHWFGWESKIAITAALCFSMSSTAIVLQTLKEKNLFNTSSGEASFSILLLQDIAVIPILAFLPWLANSEVEQVNENAILIHLLPNWLQPFSIILGVGVLILLGRYVFVPFLRYVSTSGMNELLTASSIFLVLGVSELMILVGLSPALGAFLAGVMLANSEFRHELESDIDPFRGLLLAVFFVSVGSSINFDVIRQSPIFILSTVLLVLVVKFSVLFLIGKISKMSIEQNFILSFSLSQVGEFAFVLITFAGGLSLIDPTLSSQLMAVVAITMCITPILLIFNEQVIDKYFNLRVSDNQNLSNEASLQADSKIIIAGFGYFGSTVGRLLRANGFHATVLDHNADRVKILRENGMKVFYGDATRREILVAAGIEHARILVLCLDRPEDNYHIIQIARKHYPHLEIFVRARDRIDTYDFLNKGIKNIYSQTLGTAVEMGIDILQSVGIEKQKAEQKGNAFEKIDKQMTRMMASKSQDGSSTFTIREALEYEAKLLQEDAHIFKEKIGD